MIFTDYASGQLSYKSRIIGKGGTDMVNLRHMELSKPIHQRLGGMPPKARRMLNFMEVGMLAALMVSLFLYL
jgi:hypothetical protein